MAEAAGCDAVELNFSCPQMRISGMGSDVGQDPELVTFYTAYVKRSVKIPVILFTFQQYSICPAGVVNCFRFTIFDRQATAWAKNTTKSRGL